MSTDRDATRWGGSLAVVVAAHAAAVAVMLSWQSVPLPAAEPAPAALMIELAPMPTSAPAPQAVQAERPPTPKPEPKPEPKPQPKRAEPKPKPPPPKMAEVALEQTKEAPAETAPQEHSAKPAEEAAPPVGAIAPTADRTAAPAQGNRPAAASNASPTWQGSVLAHLERHKRYPRNAQMRRNQGVSQVAFTIDRRGYVLAVRLHKSSGHDSLDEETLDLVRRAQPLPPPPSEVGGEHINLVVPVQFFLR